jgi:hypothetical protein
MSKPDVAQPLERNEAQVLVDIEAQRADLTDAQREIGELQHRRREMLTTGGVDEVQEIDTTIDRAVTKVEIAEAKITVSEGELERARAAKRDALTAANLARARQLADEGPTTTDQM